MGLTIEQIEIIISEMRSRVGYYINHAWDELIESYLDRADELNKIIKILEEFRKEG